MQKTTDGNVQILEHKLNAINIDSVEIPVYGGVNYDDFVLGRHGPLGL